MIGSLRFNAPIYVGKFRKLGLGNLKFCFILVFGVKLQGTAVFIIKSLADI